MAQDSHKSPRGVFLWAKNVHKMHLKCDVMCIIQEEYLTLTGVSAIRIFLLSRCTLDQLKCSPNLTSSGSFWIILDVWELLRFVDIIGLYWLFFSDGCDADQTDSGPFTPGLLPAHLPPPGHTQWSTQIPWSRLKATGPIRDCLAHPQGAAVSTLSHLNRKWYLFSHQALELKYEMWCFQGVQSNGWNGRSEGSWEVQVIYKGFPSGESHQGYSPSVHQDHSI